MLISQKSSKSADWTTPAVLYKLITAECWKKSKDSDKIWTDSSVERYSKEKICKN